MFLLISSLAFHLELSLLYIQKMLSEILRNLGKSSVTHILPAEKQTKKKSKYFLSFGNLKRFSQLMCQSDEAEQ